MREIKFRGKCLSGGGWVYGYYQHVNWIANYDRHQIIAPAGEQYAGRQSDVDPETVGQFTGLYDGLGKEIYEKDIIEYEGVNSEIVFHQGMFGYMKPHKNGKTKGFNKLGIIGSLEGGKSTKLYRVRVVGNRFDNPSLIKE